MGNGVDLTGVRILLVEDDMLIRTDLEDGLTDTGATVISTGRLTEAIELVEGDIGHAVLDVKLEDGNVHPIANRLAERGVPFTFYSSSARCNGLAERFPDAVVLSKPVLPQRLAAIIASTKPQGAAA